MSDVLCLILHSNMSVPTPVILTLTSVSLCLLNVLVFPELLSDTKFTSLFLYVTGVLFCGWMIWKVWIYPAFYSPLRHLPKPKVRTAAVTMMN